MRGPLRLLIAGLGAVLLAACASRSTPTVTAPVVVATATVAATPTPIGLGQAELGQVATPLPPTLAATPTAVPPTETPASMPTPAPVLRQLTSGGCCVQPAWSPDGQTVWYIDRPNDASPSGLWGVAAAGGEPFFVTDKLGIYSPDRTLFAYPQAGQTFIERAADGERWTVPAGGRAINFSPDGTRITWQVSSSGVNFDRRAVQIWVANVDGSGARAVTSVVGGGLGNWLPDGQRVLVSGRDSGDRQSFVATLNVDDGSLVTVVEAPNIRGAQVSPGGGWLSYQIAFSGDAAQDGLWVMPLTGGTPLRLDLFGAYRWRAEGRLLVIPLEPGAPAQRLVEIDAAAPTGLGQAGAARALTNPAVTPLRIAGGDWALATDGRRVVYVSADDHNLWLLELPE